MYWMRSIRLPKSFGCVLEWKTMCCWAHTHCVYMYYKTFADKTLRTLQRHIYPSRSTDTSRGTLQPLKRYFRATPFSEHAPQHPDSNAARVSPNSHLLSHLCWLYMYMCYIRHRNHAHTIWASSKQRENNLVVLSGFAWGYENARIHSPMPNKRVWKVHRISG